MLLNQLIDRLEGASVVGDPDVDVTSLAIDSRGVRPGMAFVALCGTCVDGHDFIESAIGAGAAVVVVERSVAPTPHVTVVTVDDTAVALAEMAAAFNGRPAEALFLCGVTGTDGKTSTAHLYRHILESSGWGRVGIVGTLGHGGGSQLTRTSHTTPGPVELHDQFRRMAGVGCRGVVMEVSSHAVRQHRTWGLDFDVGILTNVTHDHLDFHRSIQDYRDAKREFCQALVAPGRAKAAGVLVYSADDAVAREIGGNHTGRAIRVGIAEPDAVYTSDVEKSLDATSFRLHLGATGDVDIRTGLLGAFAPVNSALAAAGAMASGVAAADIRRGIESARPVAGRFETLGGGGMPVVVVDYAHTPNAVAKVLASCRELRPRRLTTVFGCGGERDREKRPEICHIAQARSDRVIVTMDNPRSEPLEQIVRDILAGRSEAGAIVEVDLNRSRAIDQSIGESERDDVVVILGKGHEAYQIVGDEKVPWSDRVEAEKALKRWLAHSK